MGSGSVVTDEEFVVFDGFVVLLVLLSIKVSVSEYKSLASPLPDSASSSDAHPARQELSVMTTKSILIALKIFLFIELYIPFSNSEYFLPYIISSKNTVVNVWQIAVLHKKGSAFFNIEKIVTI